MNPLLSRRKDLPMKFTLLALAALASAPALAASKTEWKSVYTNTKTDCVVVAASNDRAEIDFSDSECKAFGGYVLRIDGGDLRYGPSLSYNGQALEIGRPGAFHDPAGDKVEWIYRKTTEADGNGNVEWKGFVYRLSVSDPDGQSSHQELIAVRLDGEKTCSLGTVKNNEAARKLVQDSRAACK
jgi:hypothetical protein